MPGALVERGDRIALRTLEGEDVPVTQRLSTNPELRIPMGNPVRRLSELGDAAEDGDDDRFAVTVEADPVPGQPGEDVDPVGAISLSDMDWRRPERSDWLVPDHQGDGSGGEAVAVAIDYAVRTYDHPGIEARTYDFNEARAACWSRWASNRRAGSASGGSSTAGTSTSSGTHCCGRTGTDGRGSRARSTPAGGRPTGDATVTSASGAAGRRPQRTPSRRRSRTPPTATAGRPRRRCRRRSSRRRRRAP